MTYSRYTTQRRYFSTICPMRLPTSKTFYWVSKSRWKRSSAGAAERHLRRSAHAVGDICRLFDPQECRNYLKNAGYVAD